MQKEYEAQSIPLVVYPDIALDSLYMIKNYDEWYRSVVLQKQADKIVVKLIDCGSTINLEASEVQIKLPKNCDYERLAYAKKYKFCNINSEENRFEEGEILSIKIIEDHGDFAMAELKVDELVDEMANESPTGAVIADDVKRYAKDLKMCPFQTGNLELLYLDGSKLADGKVHVYIVSDENHEKFRQIIESVAKYVKNNPIANNYKPM
jgi:hypothetical protein